jgi:hypothetical protein
MKYKRKMTRETAAVADKQTTNNKHACGNHLQSRESTFQVHFILFKKHYLLLPVWMTRLTAPTFFLELLVSVIEPTTLFLRLFPVNKFPQKKVCDN